MLNRVARAFKGLEGGLQAQCQQLGIHVARDRNQHVFRDVVAVVELLDIVQRQVFDGFNRAQFGTAVAAVAVQARQQLVVDNPELVVEAGFKVQQPFRLEAVELLFAECRLGQHVHIDGEGVGPSVGRGGEGDIGHVGQLRLAQRGSQVFNVEEDLLLRLVLGAPQQECIGEGGNAGVGRGFDRGPGAHERLERHDVGGRVLTQNQAEAVVQDHQALGGVRRVHFRVRRDQTDFQLGAHVHVLAGHPHNVVGGDLADAIEILERKVRLAHHRGVKAQGVGDAAALLGGPVPLGHEHRLGGFNLFLRQIPVQDALHLVEQRRPDHAGAFRRILRRQLEDAGQLGGEVVGVGRRDHAQVPHDVAIDPGTAAAGQDIQQDVECNLVVQVLGFRPAPHHQQAFLLDVARDVKGFDGGARSQFRRVERRQLARFHVAEGAVDGLQGRIRINVAGHDHSHVVGHVVGVQPLLEGLQRDAGHRLRRAENRLSVGMVAVEGFPGLVGQVGIRVVVALIALAQDDVPLGPQVLLRVVAVDQHVGQQGDGVFNVRTGQRDVVLGPIEGGAGVGRAAPALDHGIDGACVLLGPVENHVFEEMGNAVVFGRFVHRTDADPDVDRGHRGAVLGRQDDRQAVVQGRNSDIVPD